MASNLSTDVDAGVGKATSAQAPPFVLCRRSYRPMPDGSLDAFHLPATVVLLTMFWLDSNVTLGVAATGAVVSGGCGVTAIDAADGGPVPTTLVARTVKVYEWPFVRPLTVQLSVPPVEHVSPPGVAVAV